MFDIRRRELIALFGSAAVWPLSVHARQSERVQRIGLLMSYLESDPEAQAWYCPPVQGLMPPVRLQDFGPDSVIRSGNWQSQKSKPGAIK